jgi:3-phenylpropionate/cinnamic acid dioxygenase small subunit
MVLSSSITEQPLQRLLLEREIERFLYREAELIDDRKYTEWLDLIADDVQYQVPIRRNVKFGDHARENSDPDYEISWIDEGKQTLTARVQQLNTGVHWAEEPVSRVRHMVTNVQISDVRGDEVDVKCCFLVYVNRVRDEENLFIGKRYDTLRRNSDTEWQIAKRVALIDQKVLLAKSIVTFL